MKVTAVIVTFNSQKVIAECLESIKREQLTQLIVVDNASSDNTIRLVKKRFSGVKLVPLTNNVGYARGNNIGIKYALSSKPDFILILNPDTILLKDSLKNLLMHAETHVQTQILGPKIYMSKKVSSRPNSISNVIWSIGGELDNKRWTAKLVGFGELDRGQFTNSRQVDFVSGTCMLIPREILEKGLRFYEPYFMYYEDVEFCIRAKKLGYPAYIVPDAELVHYETSSANSLDDHRKSLGSKLFNLPRGKLPKNYYLARNHLLFVERNAPFRVKLREVLRLPKTLSEHYRDRNYNALNGIRDYWLRNFGRYAR